MMELYRDILLTSRKVLLEENNTTNLRYCQVYRDIDNLNGIYIHPMNQENIDQNHHYNICGTQTNKQMRFELNQTMRNRLCRNSITIDICYQCLHYMDGILNGKMLINNNNIN